MTRQYFQSEYVVELSPPPDYDYAETQKSTYEKYLRKGFRQSFV